MISSETSKIEFLKSNETLLTKAMEIRLAELALLQGYSAGDIRGTVHTCLGQELSAVAVCSHLEPNRDWVLSNHRGHGHFLAFNGDTLELFAEVLGKGIGPSRGHGGSQHIRKSKFMTNGVQGGFSPIAVGIASTLSLGSLCVLFIGDGTLGEGALWEALNVASSWNVNLLVVCEDNEIAQSTLTKSTFAGDLEKRILGFGFKYSKLATNDPEKLFKQAGRIIQEMRVDCSPTFLHIKTARLGAHSKGDDNRRNSDLKELREQDLLNRILTSDQDSEVIKNLRTKVESDYEIALNSEDSTVITPSSPINDRILKNFSAESHKNFRSLLQISLRNALENIQGLHLIGEDIEDISIGTERSYGGAFKVTGTLSTEFPGRVRNFPIAESALVGVGIGRALTGHPSIIEIMFGDFMTLAFDQILQQMSKLPTMYGKTYSLPIVLRLPMGGGFGYGATHSQSLEKHLLGIPNINVIAANRFGFDSEFFKDALATGIPTILIENKSDYSKSYPIRLGANFSKTSLREFHFITDSSTNSRLLLVSYGGLSEMSHLIQIALSEQGIVVADLLILNQISPLPKETIPMRRYDFLITIEEGLCEFGLGSHFISTTLQQGQFLGKVKSIGAVGVIGSSLESEQLALPGFDSCMALIKRMVEETTNEVY